MKPLLLLVRSHLNGRTGRRRQNAEKSANLEKKSMKNGFVLAWSLGASNAARSWAHRQTEQDLRLALSRLEDNDSCPQPV